MSSLPLKPTSCPPAQPNPPRPPHRPLLDLGSSLSAPIAPPSTAVKETPGGWIPHLICQARPRWSSLLRGMEEGAEAAVTAPRLCGRAGRGLCGGADGSYDAVGFRGAEGDTGGGGCAMRGVGRGRRGFGMEISGRATAAEALIAGGVRPQQNNGVWTPTLAT